MSDHTMKTEMSFQHTLKSAIHCTGIGLHSGSKVSMSLKPADENTGITIIRTDLRGRGAVIPVRWDAVSDTRLCTVVSNADGVSVGTVEHLMAALRGCGIDNAVIELNAPEVPIMDGSAAPFVFLIECAGSVAQSSPRRVIRVLKEVVVGDENRFASFSPALSSSFSFEIDFASAAIARQESFLQLTNGAFKSELARARTFGFLHEVDQMRRAGLARGGSLDNAIVIQGDKVLNEGGLRYSDEFVRHKILDSVGDLYLAGAPIIGHFHGCRSGHALNNQLLRTLFADESAWCYDDGEAADVLPISWPQQQRIAAYA
jgi:UDP-3-O-[3-hydroxymyristoyl] N-acetylglucosamine deacetylase